MIEPPEAAIVTIKFTAFEVEQGYDRVKIYDPAASPPVLLASFSGYTIPAPVSSNSGKMLITFSSDYAIVFDGWEATYTSSNIGVQENGSNDLLSVYPNPANERVNISLKQDNNSRLNIRCLDLVGRIVYESDRVSCQHLVCIDVSSWTQGIYVLVITNNDELTGIEKFVLIR
jgi:hypothetical protein